MAVYTLYTLKKKKIRMQSMAASFDLRLPSEDCRHVDPRSQWDVSSKHAGDITPRLGSWMESIICWQLEKAGQTVFVHAPMSAGFDRWVKIEHRRRTLRNGLVLGVYDFKMGRATPNTSYRSPLISSKTNQQVLCL